MEKLKTDLGKDIRARAREQEPYLEKDLYRLLRHVGEGLLYARKLVLDT
jgi:hypothetical protein